jgi:hypothetical protein
MIVFGREYYALLMDLTVSCRSLLPCSMVNVTSSPAFRLFRSPLEVTPTHGRCARADVRLDTGSSMIDLKITIANIASQRFDTRAFRAVSTTTSSIHGTPGYSAYNLTARGDGMTSSQNTMLNSTLNSTRDTADSSAALHPFFEAGTSLTDDHATGEMKI